MPYFIDGVRLGLELVCQSVALLAVVPLMVWVMEDVPAFLVGRAVAPLGSRYRRFGHFGREILRHGIDVESGLMLTLALLALLILAGMSFIMPSCLGLVGAWLADPLLVGSLILTGALWAAPSYFGQVVRCWFVLCLMESFLVLAAPGVTGFLGVHHLLIAAPGSSLAGTALCCAVALAFLTPVPRREVLAAEMIEQAWPPSRAERDQKQRILELYRLGWVLLVGDSLLPVLFGLEGLGSVAGFIGRFMGGAALIIIGRATGLSRYRHFVALLLGLAGLMALAGRFAV